MALTAHHLTLIANAQAEGPADRNVLAERIATAIARDDRFHSTMNRGRVASAIARADEALYAFETASPTALKKAKAARRHLNRQLGIPVNFGIPTAL